MKQDKTLSPPTPRRRFDPGRGAFMVYLGICTSTLLCQPAFAADTIWTKASDIMKDVYTQILAISTIAAIVTAAVALLMMNFSRSGRTVDSAVITYGHFRRHCSMDCGTSHARPGFDKHISFGRSGL